jgi:hypothetical protein
MIRCLLLSLILLPFFSIAQGKVGKLRSEVRQDISTWISKNNHYYPSLKEADSVMTLSIRDMVYGKVQFQYTFNKDSICITEKTITSCDSCRRNYLNAVLEQGGYEWRRLNGNQYISKFGDHLMIEIPGNEKDMSFTIYQVAWTKEVYDMLLKN